MWYFISPEIVYGEDALSRLDELEGERALIVTDKQIVGIGFADKVKERLLKAGIDCQIYDDIEPDPSIETTKKGAQVAREYKPDWILGLGGGSAMDAAKAIWVLYERPDIEPGEINPFTPLGLRQKAKLITIPTTSGTGSDCTWGIVLTDTFEKRKLALGCREVHADIAIIDPIFVTGMPPQLTSDTGLDALTHAIEGFTSNWKNDFCDGLCLKAIQLVFQYLQRAYHDGQDKEAREKMHNAASIAGLGFGNSMTGLAHGMGHSLGAEFHTPHGKAVGLFLPYTIEFTANVSARYYSEITHLLNLKQTRVEKAAHSLAQAIRQLEQNINQPLTIKDLGISYNNFKNSLDKLVSNADMDTQTVTAARIPTSTEFERLFRYAYDGKSVDF
ncbi:MAG TPA: iron-containing alcohol dehydrogenase [Dehalococcoidia bacterium]|nr:iron-containing alcohol dehydrogenase [Dehalococcoidia bacterium]